MTFEEFLNKRGAFDGDRSMHKYYNIKDDGFINHQSEQWIAIFDQLIELSEAE